MILLNEKIIIVGRYNYYYYHRVYCNIQYNIILNDFFSLSLLSLLLCTAGILSLGIIIIMTEYDISIGFVTPERRSAK